MSSVKTSIDRKALLATCTMLKPALATQNFIPALQHILFKDGYAMAYNDVMAARVKTPLPIDGVCIPGDLLIRALSSFKGDTVVLSDDGQGGILVASGKSKMRVPCLPAAQYPFAFPELGAEFADVTPAFVRGMECCLAAVGSDPTHPAQQGITIESSGGPDQGAALLFSTDNFTISSYRVDDAGLELVGDVPVLLPTSFATYLVSLRKSVKSDAVVTLAHVKGGLAAIFGDDLMVFTKGLIDLDPLDFSAVMQRHKKSATEGPQKLPPDLEDALSRALLVLSSEVDKITEFHIATDKLVLRTSTTVGQSEDTVVYDADSARVVKVDPALVLRGMKYATDIEFMGGAMLLSDGSYEHMISYCN